MASPAISGVVYSYAATNIEHADNNSIAWLRVLLHVLYVAANLLLAARYGCGVLYKTRHCDALTDDIGWRITRLYGVAGLGFILSVCAWLCSCIC